MSEMMLSDAWRLADEIAAQSAIDQPEDHVSKAKDDAYMQLREMVGKEGITLSVSGTPKQAPYNFSQDWGVELTGGGPLKNPTGHKIIFNFRIEQVAPGQFNVFIDDKDVGRPEQSIAQRLYSHLRDRFLEQAKKFGGQ